LGTVTKLDVGKDGVRLNRRGFYLRHENVGPVGMALTAIEARAVRRYLELVAKRILSLEHNVNYAAAYKQAARVIRQMKPD